MNRNELVDAVAERIGDRRTAAAAVDAVLATVTRTVSAGEKVSLFGFGVFERVERAARTARNPSTGAAVSLPARAVPRFRPGQALKDAVGAGGTSAEEDAKGEKPTGRGPQREGPAGEEPEADEPKVKKSKSKESKGKEPKTKEPKTKEPKTKGSKTEASKSGAVKDKAGKQAGKGGAAKGKRGTTS